MCAAIGEDESDSGSTPMTVNRQGAMHNASPGRLVAPSPEDSRLKRGAACLSGFVLGASITQPYPVHFASVLLPQVIEPHRTCLAQCSATAGNVVRISPLFLAWQIDDGAWFPIQTAAALVTDHPWIIMDPPSGGRSPDLPGNQDDLRLTAGDEDLVSPWRDPSSRCAAAAPFAT